MSDRVSLDVSAERLTGDYGRDYYRVTIGSVEVIVYESSIRPGGVTVEIDTDGESDTDLSLLSVNVNDSSVFHGTDGCRHRAHVCRPEV